ncbi:poly-gamma-glutamate hydrolase family protein [Halomicrobium urmianum]|uniref:poly-gamma-glutamate hydrolase family protein n=1 Tax=Halomicrobium urmianum TaxID=1586233 RepID=UPI001CD96E8E|nr:poly-gamma-glutamate hydrolase family protein [Halomicrobium urmianum]
MAAHSTTGRWHCDYRVDLAGDAVRITLRERRRDRERPDTVVGLEPGATEPGVEAADGQRRRTHRFVAAPDSVVITGGSADVTVDGSDVSLSGPDGGSAPAAEASIEHPAVTAPAPVDGVTVHRLRFAPDHAETSVTVEADDPIVAVDAHSRVPFRESATDDAVEWRGSGPLTAAVVTASGDPIDGVFEMDRETLAVEPGRPGAGSDAPAVVLGGAEYEDWFGRTVPVAGLDGITYVDGSRIGRGPGRPHRHGERCLVRDHDGEFDLDVRGAPERYVAVDDELATVLGCDLGTQVLVTRSDGDDAVYTVGERGDLSDVAVGMTTGGRDRLGAPRDGQFTVTVTPVVAAPHLARHEARRAGAVAERLADAGGDRLVACAPHGGVIEGNTDLQAHRLVDRLSAREATAWSVEGWDDDAAAFDRYHVRSSDVDPRSFPLLARIADRGFERAVSFHCHDNDGVVVGGRAPEPIREGVAAAVSEALAGTGIEVSLEGKYMGRRPENLVNWLTADGESGIQIEQSIPTVDRHWRAVADAVAEWFRDRR